MAHPQCSYGTAGNNSLDTWSRKLSKLTVQNKFFDVTELEAGSQEQGVEPNPGRPILPANQLSKDWLRLASSLLS